MKQVTREQFYQEIDTKDVMLQVNGNSTEFRLKSNLEIIGEIIDTIRDGEEVSDYYLKK